MDFRDLYKNRRIPTLSDTVAKHYQNIITSRQEKQREFFWSKRGQHEIAPQKTEALEKKKKTRMEMLMKWKAEKQKKMEEEKKKCKPVFKVGVVQKKVTGSPLLIEKKNCRDKPQKKNEKVIKSQLKTDDKCEGIVTRSKARIQKTLEEIENKDKQLNLMRAEEQKPKTNFKLNNKFCKVEIGKIKKVNSFAFKVPEQVAALPYSNKLTFPDSPKITKKKNCSSFKSDLEKEIPFLDYEEKPKMCVGNNENVESKENELKIAQKVSEIQICINSDPYKQIHYSPFAKGGNNKIKNNDPFDHEIKNKENEFHHKIFSFREYIDCKTKMLLEKCEKWKNICTKFEGPSEIQGEIDSIIGKTKLLTSDKFLQFKNLINKCDNGDPLINIEDLEGFKDWVSIEVEKINEDFENLEKLKGNNWVPESFPVENLKNKKKKNFKNKKPVAKSSIRAHIQAARKKLKNENHNFNFEIYEANTENEKTSKTPQIIKETSQLLVGNNHILDLNQFLPRNKEESNSNLEIISYSGKKMSTKNNFPNLLLNKPGIENLANNKVKVEANILNQKHYRSSEKGNLKTTPNALNSLKNHFDYEHDSVNLNKGLSEKYFRHPENDDKTPLRVILGEMNSNVTPIRITRSRCDKYQNLI